MTSGAIVDEEAFSLESECSLLETELSTSCFSSETLKQEKNEEKVKIDMNIFSEYILSIVRTKGQIPQRLIFLKGFGCFHICFLFFGD